MHNIHRFSNQWRSSRCRCVAGEGHEHEREDAKGGGNEENKDVGEDVEGKGEEKCDKGGGHTLIGVWIGGRKGINEIKVWARKKRWGMISLAYSSTKEVGEDIIG